MPTIEQHRASPSVRSSPGPSFGPSLGKDHFTFLDYLRAMAAWAVVWDHVFGDWPEQRGTTLRVVIAVRTAIAEPFGIIQDFGWMAVSVFFLVSGFIISHVAIREGAAEFLVKRFFRIYPLLALFVAVSLLMDPALRSNVDAAALLANVTLANYIISPQVITLGVAWTLAIEVVFYLMTPLTAATRRPGVIIGVNLLISCAVIATCRRFGADYFLFAATIAYVPYLVAGQVFYFGLYRRSLSPTATTVALAACFATLIYGLRTIHTAFLPVTHSYLINFVYACVLFCVFLQLNARLQSNRAVRFLAASSFAVYLVHGTVGRAVFDAIWPWGAAPAIAASLLATAAVAAGVHVWLERPLLRIGQRAALRFRPARAPKPSVTPRLSGPPGTA